MFTRSDIENTVRELIGTPWMHQGRTTAGIDCVGEVVYIGKKLKCFSAIEIEEIDIIDYKREPDTSQTLLTKLNQYLEEIPIKDSREGDVLTFRLPGEQITRHVGIIVRGQREYNVVHSLLTKNTSEEPLRRWSRYITHAYKFKGVQD